MFEKISPLYFILAFAAGLFYCYLVHPLPEVVYKFPSPTNAGKVVYKDKNEQCYKFKADKVACPIDRTLIKPQPIEEDFANKKAQ